MEQPGAEKTILVVDDEEAVVEFVTALLEDMGFRVLRAYEGRSALEIAQAQHPDLILSDIMMPIMDGIKFFNSLKKNPETASIPVVAITSFVERHPLKSLLSVGFKDVICKPFNKEDVIRTVQSLLGDEGQ